MTRRLSARLPRRAAAGVRSGPSARRIAPIGAPMVARAGRGYLRGPGRIHRLRRIFRGAVRLFCRSRELGSADDEAPATLARLKESGFAIGSDFQFRRQSLPHPRRPRPGPVLRFDHDFVGSGIRQAVAAACSRPRWSKHSLAPGEALHVGDSVAFDICGAAAAGIPSILIDPNGHHDGTGERPACYDHCFRCWKSSETN